MEPVHRRHKGPISELSSGTPVAKIHCTTGFGDILRPSGRTIQDSGLTAHRQRSMFGEQVLQDDMYVPSEETPYDQGIQSTKKCTAQMI